MYTVFGRFKSYWHHWKISTLYLVSSFSSI
jgi:hypothetical protein